MAVRNDLPRIKPQETPTMFNQSAGVGAFTGGMLAAIPIALAFGKGRLGLGAVLATVGTLGGGLWGAISGKSTQEKEQIEGRIVKEPGYFNRGIIAGIGITMLLSFVPVVGLVMGPVAMVIGAVAGSIIRNNSLQRDFDRAIAIRDQQQAQATAAAQGMGRGQQPGYMNSVNPAEAAELASKQKTSASHADAVSQQAAQQTAAAR